MLEGFWFRSATFGSKRLFGASPPKFKHQEAAGSRKGKVNPAFANSTSW
jgi:hypothetical protein